MKFNRILTVLFTLAVITVNALANILPFNGQTTGDISDRFPIRFVPAGYVFSIWGLIYLGLLAFAVYQALPAQSGVKLFDRIAPLYWLSSLANAVWIALWHYEYFPATLLVMLVLLACLILIYRQLKAGPQPGPAFAWSVQLPFSVYLGWISVATIANVSQVLYVANWSGWGLSDTAWAAIMLLVASALGALMLQRERDIAYVLVLIWAFAGIAVAQGDSFLVANSALALAALLAVAAVFVAFRRPAAAR